MLFRSRNGSIPGFAWIIGGRNKTRPWPVGVVWNGRSLPSTVLDHSGRFWRVQAEEWRSFKHAFSVAVKRAPEAVRARIGARGLTQKSWYDLMVKIASGEPVVGFSDTVRRARPVKGNSRDVAEANGYAYPSGFILTVTNSSGITAKTGGQRKLNSAIAFRRQFFANNLTRGFYNDARFVARNYPWAKVK